ncbi:molybdopterin molybdotransferase MoeA [Brachybacterium hainanense]|uniref:Molybdopterin molybdenumtransferase n=1 Tax=Brachybacterium hainanense TaxID=1541174 RepID=A0ABV6RH85_9MICO
MEDRSRIPLADHRDDAIALLGAHRRHRDEPVTEILLGRVCASDVRSRVDVPALDNSQMDGFAVVAADLRAPGEEVRLRAAAAIAAGQGVAGHVPGTASPIMTGAPIPTGADLVVPVEESAPGSFDALPAPGESIALRPAAVDAGRFVRRAASDTRAGDVILREGTVLTPARIAHLAACGVERVRTLAPMRALVISTGSEVRSAERSGGLLREGAAFDANGPGLAAALLEAGAEIAATATVPDDPEELRAAIGRLTAETGADLVVTSGGVSAGAYEVVRQAAELPGVRLSFPKVALQPGGPQGIGIIEIDGHRLPWLAFPGNPVSALLSLELIARPALGAPPRTMLRAPLRLEEPQSSPVALEQYRRARLLPSGEVRLVSGASSHLLGALALSDALVRIPVGVDMVHDGDMLETILLPGAGA